MYDIRFIPPEEWQSILPLLDILNNHTISMEVLQERLDEMKNHSYKCIGVYDGEKLIGITGIWILNKFYNGKHIEPDNVMVLPEYRSQKIGELMMNWVHDYGRSQGCIASELNAYVINDKGIRFWINQGYKILGFHFHKKL
ncbi:GNAT family N-acetyltransferase [Pseudoflavitalea sp. G-6-1-2]|uniref:GNAT family N-acetyltransferase n=1 Tax=Pseudoflavitalea sp. G-6-1-2 TaxID=2728841 RepID=UPI001469D828|nr:GNAT family N-acetyltransferase [Pseudoflavitalea sp. G-6-1-2]NML22829.1 GNAT family N-acetyltransferase [Pseudoflavitalea sp. G-6-1-2]